MPRNTLSRDNGVSNVASARSDSRRHAINPNPPSSTRVRNARYSGPTIDSANVWTDARMLPRVRNVPRTVSANVPTISDRFQTFSIPRRSCTSTECRNAVPKQPRQQRDVLDRVPRPVPAPAEDAVGPQRAQRQADRQEDPGRDRPSARDAHPRVTHPPRDQRGDRERERHREPDEPEVQERRVRRHQRMVLQQRERAAPVGRSGGERRERRRGPQDQDQVERRDAEHHRERPREGLGAAATEPEGDRGQVATEDEVPQQQRALVRGPECQHLEEGGGRAAGVRRDVAQREVVREQRREHREVRDDDEREQRVRRRARALDHARAAGPRADDRGRHPVDREGERQRERQRADQRRHQVTSSGGGVSPGGGGRYSSPCLTSMLSEWNAPSVP